MLIKVAGELGPLKADTSHEGDEGHDHCPNCGSESKMVGTIGGKEDYVHARMYSCDVKDGGCGVPHTRTTKWGVAQDALRGVRSALPVTSALVNRTVFTPTEAYRSNYERIFGHE